MAAGDGIELVANYGVTVDLLGTNPGLVLTGTSPGKELAAKVNVATGLKITSDGIEINYGCGLTVEDDVIKIGFNDAAGITCDGGLKINARYGLGIYDNYLDVVSGGIDFAASPPTSGTNPLGNGQGIYFVSSAPYGVILAPGDWLHIV